MYWDPILSSMNMLRADKILSGLSALSNNNLWKAEISLKALGRSVISGFSWSHHLFHWRFSTSNEEQRLF